MLSFTFFNIFGIMTTKYASATHRSTIDVSRTVVIWSCSCIFIGEAFKPWAIPGLLMIVIGTLLYNEILYTSFLGFDYNTKKAIAERNKEKKGEDEPMIIQMS